MLDILTIILFSGEETPGMVSAVLFLLGLLIFIIHSVIKEDREDAMNSKDSSSNDSTNNSYSNNTTSNSNSRNSSSNNSSQRSYSSSNSSRQYSSNSSRQDSSNSNSYKDFSDNFKSKFKDTFKSKFKDTFDKTAQHISPDTDLEDLPNHIKFNQQNFGGQGPVDQMNLINFITASIGYSLKRAIKFIDSDFDEYGASKVAKHLASILQKHGVVTNVVLLNNDLISTSILDAFRKEDLNIANLKETFVKQGYNKYQAAVFYPVGEALWEVFQDDSMLCFCLEHLCLRLAISNEEGEKLIDEILSANQYQQFSDNDSVRLDQAYEFLEIDMNANEQEVKRAKRRLFSKWHPDKAPQGREDFYGKQFKKVIEAYNIIAKHHGWE